MCARAYVLVVEQHCAPSALSLWSHRDVTMVPAGRGEEARHCRQNVSGPEQ